MLDKTEHIKLSWKTNLNVCSSVVFLFCFDAWAAFSIRSIAFSQHNVDPTSTFKSHPWIACLIGILNFYPIIFHIHCMRLVVWSIIPIQIIQCMFFWPLKNVRTYTKFYWHWQYIKLYKEDLVEALIKPRKVIN